MAKITLQTEPRLTDPSYFSFWHEAIIRHCDLDPNNHVTNSVICAWFDDGRYALILETIQPLMTPGDFPVLGTVTVDFHREVRFGQKPRIGTAVLSLGMRSLTMAQAIFCGEECVATATSVTVLMDGGTRRPRELGVAVNAALMALKTGER